MHFTSDILCLLNLMHDPLTPALEHATTLSMDCCDAVTDLSRAIHVNALL